MGNQHTGLINLEEGFGYRVIKIAEGSPCEIGGLEAFQDYIIDIDKQRISNQKKKKQGECINFFQIVSQFENKELELTVYNLKSRSERSVFVRPSHDWPDSDSLLGVILRYENYKDAHENTFKIINVQEGSPAQKANLKSQEDFVVGLVNYKIDSLESLIDKIIESQYQEKKGIDLVIYNIKENSQRIVFLEPKFKWGGKGCVGCEFGSGILNNLPIVQQEIIEDLDQFQQSQEKYEQNLDKIVNTINKENSFLNSLNRKKKSPGHSNAIFKDPFQDQPQQQTENKIQEQINQVEIKQMPFEYQYGKNDKIIIEQIEGKEGIIDEVQEKSKNQKTKQQQIILQSDEDENDKEILKELYKDIETKSDVSDEIAFQNKENKQILQEKETQIEKNKENKNLVAESEFTESYDYMIPSVENLDQDEHEQIINYYADKIKAPYQINRDSLFNLKVSIKGQIKYFYY